MKHKKTTLKNGLRIITVPMKETQTATVMIGVGVGSRYESQGEAGLSHFIEHMMFKGTQKRPNTLAISEELDAIGGEYNAFTAKDKTVYYAKADADKLGTALDVITDMFLHSKMDAEEIEREKGTILQEISMYEDLPMRTIGTDFEELLYQKNSLGHDELGNNKTVSSFRRKNFVDYLERFYVASDTVVCVAGKIDEPKVISSLNKYLGSMKKGVKPKFQKIREAQKEFQISSKFKKTDQTHFILGSRAFHENHPDRFALSLLSIILGGNMSSRLFIEVRERRGLAYHISTSVEAYADCGYIATQAGVEHKNLEVAVKTVLEEYRKIASQKVGEKELQKAKDYIHGRRVMNLESSDEVAMFVLDQEIRKKKILTIDELLEKINKVTAGDIQRVAQKVFSPQNLNLAVIGPHRNCQSLRKILKF